MRKRFVKVVLFGALALATTTSFISCKDYDDDIKRIDSEIGQINGSLDELKTAIGNNGIKSVTYDAATGKLTIVDANDKSSSCVIAQNLPEYTIEVAGGKVVLKKDGQEVSSANLPAAAAGFDPAKLTINTAGEVSYDGIKTGVKVPASSIAVIKDGETTVGYKFTIDGVEYPFYIADAMPLSSLVFQPSAYLSGVEAMKAANLTYTKWAKNAYTLSAVGETWQAPVAAAAASHITPDMVAYYHVSPIGVTMKQISKLVLTADDKDFIGTRAAFAIGDIDLAKCEIKDGLLRIAFNGNSEAIQKIDAKKITVMNLKATVTNMYGSKTIQSDYAAIYKSVMKDFILANPKSVGAHKAHLYGANNGKAGDAINADPICEVAYDNANGIDLKDYVETHYTEWTDAENPTKLGDEKSLSNANLADYGLKLVYSLSDYYQGEENKTNQSSFAKLDGSVLKANIEGVTEAPIAAVGRMPLVRVELQRISDGEVVNVGWIKVQITRGDVAGHSWTKDCGKFNLSCNDQKYSVEYMEMNVNIYQKLGLTKADFHAIYELDVDANGNAKLNATDNGAVAPLTDADADRETICLKWTLTPFDALNAIKKDGKVSATATYKPKNDDSRGNVTITFTAVVNAPFASFDPNSKNSNYWYNENSRTRINTVTPSTGATAADCKFFSILDDTFMGNSPVFKLNAEVSDDFKLDKIQHEYIFSDINKDRVVKGNDGKDYKLSVTAKGKELRANTKLVAQIVETTNSKNKVVEMVEYLLTDEAKAVLNLDAHDGEKVFTAKLDMVLTNGCGMNLPMTDGQFTSEFLRPVNVTPLEGKFFVDATDNGYTVKMLDLVYLTDWRDYKFAKGTSASGVNYDGTGYYAYYGVESIVADIAKITTNMGNSNIEDHVNGLLSKANQEIKISQENSTTVGDYGTITYKNNGNNVKAFKIKIPVTVNYKWGSVTTAVYMDVKSTEGN